MAPETILKSTEAKQPTPSSVIRPFPHQGRCHVKTKGNHERETRGRERGPPGRRRDPRAGRRPGRRLHPRPGLPRRGQPRLGEDDPRPPVPPRRPEARGDGPLRHPLRDQGRTRRRGEVARLVARRHHPPGAGRPGSGAGAGQPVLHVPALRGRAGRDDQGHPRRGRADQAQAGRHRLALRDAAARPEPAPLPPADPRPEAVLHRPGMHGVPARRPDVRDGRPAAPEHRPRRREPGAALARVRGRAAAAPHHEAPGAEVPGRLPRLRHRSRGASTSSRGSSPPSTTTARSAASSSPATPSWMR